MAHNTRMNEEIIMNEIINFIENTPGELLFALGIMALFILAILHYLLSPKKRAAMRQAEEEIYLRGELKDPMKFVGPPTRMDKIMRDTDWCEVAVDAARLYGKTVEKSLEVGKELGPVLAKGGVVIAIIELTGGV